MRSQMTFRIAISKEEDKWVAVSVDHPIVAQGDSPELAVKELVCSYVIRVEVAAKKGFDPFAGLPPPSQFTLEAFQLGTRVEKPELEIPAGLLMSAPSIDARMLR